MTKKNKFLVTSFTVAAAAATICCAIALMPKMAFKALGQNNEVWKHYSERMPGINPGIKEYWVSCDDNSHRFTAPSDVTIQDATGWDTSGFEVDDDRYTYQCSHKIADSAIAGTTANTSQPAPSYGFSDYQGKTFTANGYQGFDVDVSGYDYITFAVRHNLSYLGLFGGGSCGSDDQEVAIEKNDNLVMWKDVWYYISLERNADGKWDAYVGRYNFPKRYAASIKMGDQAKNGTNLKDIFGVWTWDALKAEDMIYSTAVYGGEKSHHYVWSSTSISPVETGVCSVCGDVVERPAPAIDFTTNKFGAKLINKTAGVDVSDYTSGSFSGKFLNVESSTSLSYLYYNWNTFQMYLPRIDFSKYSSVSFDLASIVRNTGGDDGLTGATNYYKIGFAEGSMQVFSATAAGCVLDGGTLSFTTYGNKVVGKVSLGLVSELTFNITDANVINGNESVILYVSCGFNTGSCAIKISNPVLAVKPEAADITDESIKAVQLNKQVRRVEQQDHWKTDPDYATYNNESGHADYFKFGNREAIHFSAHYANDDPKFGYNSGWSEWRFTHAQAGLKSVTFTYLYEDTNTDTSDDGSGPVHTMAQWYGAAYQARTLTLNPDGQWHTVTVTGDAYDITHFVIKIFHFTGDIYISNIIYSTTEADVTDASIKEIQLNKQVRRVEQQDHWKTDPDYSEYNNESGHAEYFKCGDKDAIHFSAHYANSDPEFTYNNSWSEWRFAHAKAGLTSVTFTYCYEDSNTDTSNDGSGDVHTMAQWYGAAYQGRTMNLVADGQWHTITVTGEAYDITHFVMKIYHFTGDIYISNIIYA